MNIRTHLIILIATVLCLPIQAQDNDMRLLYNEAEEAYTIGRVEQAKTLVQDHIRSFQGNLKVNGYKLLALCCLALDEPETAEMYAAALLDEDPYFSPSLQDPPRFIDIINNIKRGMSITITTASSQEENLSEVPVPTTLITEDMIKNSGAQNLQEVLAAYVPGMHIIDCNYDINIAMRGIYGAGQENILILLNGHRLNSYTTNVAAPDYSITLDNLKQIEVLRGPASSLYGDVALTSVVNLITKQGADVNGVEVKAGFGNYGQKRASAVFGKRYFDVDLLVWGSFYGNKGQKREALVRHDIYDIPGDIKVGWIGEKPSYDFGVQLKWKDLEFLYDSHFSEVVAPLSISTLASYYDHDRYKTANGLSPSYASNSRHANLSYRHQFRKFNLTGSFSFDQSDLTRYQVIYDGPLDNVGVLFSLPESVDTTLQNSTGTARFINAQELAYSAQLKGDFTYINKDHHKGSLAFGAQYAHFILDDMRYQIIYDFVKTTPENYLMQEFAKGHENSFYFFTQLKHQWRSLIFNAGIRYDHKSRYDETRLNEFSPRLALIYVQPKWNVKLNYSKSFVDAPYYYRKSNGFLLDIQNQAETQENDEDYSDSDSYYKLKPEIINSVQLAFAGIEWFPGFTFELNWFYHNAQDLMVTYILEYMNAGKNTATGLELMALYRHKKFSADFNLTWTHTIKNTIFKTDENAELFFDANIDDNNNTPAIISNLVLSWTPIKRLKLFSHICFEGKQTTYNPDIVKLIQIDKELRMAIDPYCDIKDRMYYINHARQLTKEVIYHEDMNARAIVNVGAEYQLGKLTLGLNVHNLFNTYYLRSGMNTKTIPQKGRWFMGTIAYKF